MRAYNPLIKSELYNLYICTRQSSYCSNTAGSRVSILHIISFNSSVVSKRTTSLYRASLALRWLSVLHITLRWLPAFNIALVWLQTTRFFITRAPNKLTRLEVELQPIHWLPTSGSGSKH